MPMKALTATAVEAAKLPKNSIQIEYFDSGYPGLCLRVGKRRKTWSMFYRRHGKLNRMSLGIYPAMTLAEAREAWRKTREAVARGVDPSNVPGEPTAPTFGEVAEEWLKRDQAGKKSEQTIRRMVARLFLPAWSNRPVTEITRKDAIGLVDGIMDSGKVIMARRAHAHLHRLFKWSVARDIIQANPLNGAEMPGDENPRDRVLSDSELAKIWRGTEQLAYPHGPAHRLLILTGARRTEITELKWSEIDGDTIRLKGERTKNAQPHDIPLSSPAKAIIESLPHTGELVFGHVTAWSAAKAKLDSIVKLEPWRVHDYRRTVATGMQKLGVNLQTIETVLGHVGGSRRGIVGTYQRHDFAPEARAALGLWGEHVAELT